MIELQFSMMDTKTNANQTIRLALDEFEKLHGVKVNLRILSWDTGWSDLVKTALYKAGADVSEIGTTWLEGFISSNAVRKFEQCEIDALGGPSVFLPSMWSEGIRPTDSVVWGIP